MLQIDIDKETRFGLLGTKAGQYSNRTY